MHIYNEITVDYTNVFAFNSFWGFFYKHFRFNVSRNLVQTAGSGILHPLLQYVTPLQCQYKHKVMLYLSNH